MPRTKTRGRERARRPFQPFDLNNLSPAGDFLKRKAALKERESSMANGASLDQSISVSLDADDADDEVDEERQEKSLHPDIMPSMRPEHHPEESEHNMIQAADQTNARNKRSAEEEIQPENEQPQSKRRKSLQDVGPTNSRINGLASSMVEPPAEQSPLMISKLVEEYRGGKSRMVLHPSPIVPSSINHWPRMMDSDSFFGSDIANQRIELMRYKTDLFAYVNTIKAGAIPTGLVASFFKRLDMHLSDMDNIVETLQQFQQDNVTRIAQISALVKQVQCDQYATIYALSDLANI